MRILPGVLKELAKHIPTILFQTVEWGELASELPKISRRMIQKEGFDNLAAAQKAILDPYSIHITDQNLSSSPVLKNRPFGEKLLTLYFAQLYSPAGLFLDLRPEHFSFQGQDLLWHPTGLWTQFDPAFKAGLLKVYEGFYLENDDLYYEGLAEIGLLKKDFSPEDKKKLGDLFRAQFGQGLDEDVKFEVEHLKNSIIQMSNFMMERKLRISKDFLYLGIYLLTLYSTLEGVPDKLPVKKIYLDIKKASGLSKIS